MFRLFMCFCLLEPPSLNRAGPAGAPALHPRAFGAPAESLHALACPLISPPGFRAAADTLPAWLRLSRASMPVRPALRLHSAMIFTPPPFLQAINYVRK
jgi:hypothetical protein